MSEQQKQSVQRIAYNVQKCNRARACRARAKLPATSYQLLAYPRGQSPRGFTLVELVVVMGILVAISAIVLVNYNRFGSQTLLRNLAYDIALSVREAQVYGISARSFQGSNFAAGHGVFFDLNDGDDFFFLYTDVNGDNFFSSASSEWVETYTIGRGYRVDRLCVPSRESENCSITTLDMLFKRPEPDAIIRASSGAGFAIYDRVRIVVTSPQEERLSVLVETTGQVSVQRYDEI